MTFFVEYGVSMAVIAVNFVLKQLITRLGYWIAYDTHSERERKNHAGHFLSLFLQYGRPDIDRERK